MQPKVQIGELLLALQGIVSEEARNIEWYILERRLRRYVDAGLEVQQ